MHIITFKTTATEINGLQVGKISKLGGKNSCKIGERQNYILLRQTNCKINAVGKISELSGKTSCKIKERIIL